MYCSSNGRHLLLSILVLQAAIAVQVVVAIEGHLFTFDHLGTIQSVVRQHVEMKRRRTNVILYPNKNDRSLQVQSASASITTQGENNELPSSSFDLREMCHVIERSFHSDYNVTCTCAGNVIDNFSIACDYLKPICNQNNNNSTTTKSSLQPKTCGIPQIAISMVKQQIFSSTTCIHNYTRNDILQNNTCVFVDACANNNNNNDVMSTENGIDSTTSITATNRELYHPQFCDCTASYNNEICQSCQICNNKNMKTAISVDCSNINPEAISSPDTCTEIDIDLDLSASDNTDTSSSITGFVPDFTGFCTQLEDSLNNTISCDCSNIAIDGSYNISCSTNNRICVHDDTIHCGTVDSTVSVIDGTIHTITACAAYDTEPFITTTSSTLAAGSGVTCTTINLCQEENNDIDSEQVCSCSATYENQNCNSCSVIRRDDDTIVSTIESQSSFMLLPDITYIRLDCSNIHPDAITDVPQPIYGSQSYEFLPYYSRTIIKNNSNDDISFDNTKSSSSISINHCRYYSSIYFVATVLSTMCWII